ncbi:hypothetical protein [Sphingomonas sp. ACRSK]|uniref:hypothetical protein n=1 Tax=Sphingomonas sp. ACRSK TaxID=2918213 RepID=UPI001EF58C3E|nr:hypothetical protein [Sphingomonas sp. ACRSK]MCG7346599.1 hypothetical protein [Sphingomonas sp. ACRSK]
MKLATYLAENKITYAAFAERIGVANASVVQRYAVGRVPRDKKVMAAIIRETGGSVTANDFYAKADA